MARVVVVGGGIAGHEAAWGAKKTDPRCHVVLLQEELHPLYSACVLADYISGEVPRERVFLLNPDDYARAGIEFVPGCRVMDWDPGARVLKGENQEFRYDSLILATGSKPVIPTIPGVELSGVMTLKTLADADRIAARVPGRCVVVGGGPVGVECALALLSKDWRVCLVEMMPRVLPRILDEPTASTARRILEKMGVKVYLGAPVNRFLGGDNLEAVETEWGILDADVAIMVLGMRPEVTLAVKGGLHIGISGAIEVDEFMGVGLEGVYACGDCVESRELITSRKGLHMLWGNARRQGLVAGSNAGGGKRRFWGSLNVTTVRLGEKAVASMGFTKAELTAQDVKVVTRRDHGGNEISLVLLEERVVGVQAVGCVERVGGFLGPILAKLRALDLVRRAGRDPREVWPMRGLESLIKEQI